MLSVDVEFGGYFIILRFSYLSYDYHEVTTFSHADIQTTYANLNTSAGMSIFYAIIKMFFPMLAL